MVKNYESRALSYAERYGILDYKVIKNIMRFNVSYPAYLGNPRYTVQHEINLDTGKETTKRLKRFDSKGLCNRG